MIDGLLLELLSTGDLKTDLKRTHVFRRQVLCANRVARVTSRSTAEEGLTLDWKDKILGGLADVPPAPVASIAICGASILIVIGIVRTNVLRVRPVTLCRLLAHSALPCPNWR